MKRTFTHTTITKVETINPDGTVSVEWITEVVGNRALSQADEMLEAVKEFSATPSTPAA